MSSVNNIAEARSLLMREIQLHYEERVRRYDEWIHMTYELRWRLGFEEVLREMDGWFIAWQREEEERSRRLTYTYERLRATEFLPQSGDELTDKEHARRAFTRSRTSRRFYKAQNKLVVKKEFTKLDNLRKDMHVSSQKDKKIQPQSGLVDFWPSFNSPDELVKRFEDLILFVAQIANAKDSTQFSIACLQYSKTFLDKSASSAFLEVIQTIVNGEDQRYERASEFLVDCHSGSEVVDGLKHLSKSFNLLSGNPIHRKISYILSACVCAGLCNAADVTFSAYGIKMFGPEMVPKHISAPKLVDAILSTIIYFVEGGYEYFKTGSFGGFLFSNDKVEKLQDDYNFLRSNAVNFKNNMLETNAGITNQEYSKKLDDTLKGLKRLLNETEGAERVSISRMISIIYDLRVEFNATLVKGGIREAPYTILLSGPSGVGKSALSGCLPAILGKMNGYDGSPECVATVKADDKFQPTIHGSTTTIILDDVFNTHPDFLQISPTDNIITFSNNTIAYANKAEIEGKGAVPINPKALIISSNLDNMGAHMGSNEPASVIRRAMVTIRVRVKPAYRKDGGNSLDAKKVTAAFGDSLLPDVWELFVYEPVVVPNDAGGGKDKIDYRPYVHEGVPLLGCSIHTVVRWMRDHSAEHFASQKALVARVNNAHKQIQMCGCGHINLCCVCPPHLPDHSTGISVECKPESGMEGLSIVKANWESFLLEKALSYCTSSDIYVVARDKEFLDAVNTVFSLISLVGFLICFASWWAFPAFFALFIICINVGKHHLGKVYGRVSARHQDFFREAVKRDDCILSTVNKIRSVHIAAFVGASTFVAVAYKLAKAYMNIAKVLETHGSLTPTDQEDIDARDKETNIWLKPVVEKQVFNRRLLTATSDQVAEKVANNLCYMRIKDETGKAHVCDCIFLRTGVCVMPYHMLFLGSRPEGDPGTLKIEFVRRGLDCVGATFSGFISKHSWVRVEGTDFVVALIDSGGSMADISYLLTETPYSGPARFIYKRADGSIRDEATTVMHWPQARHIYCEFDGLQYHLSGGTSKGLCMGVVLTLDKGKRIAGFHLGGTSDGSGFGVSGILYKNAFEVAVSELDRKRIVTHGLGEIPETIFGKPVIADASLNDRSPINFYTETSSINVFGSCNGGVTATSSVVQSMISDTVEEVTGVPNTWGPPKMRPSYLPWHTHMQRNVPCGFDPTVVQWAREDYLKPILEDIKHNSVVKNMIRPLNDIETINGVPGQRFLDAMNMSTSLGFPLSGPKSERTYEIECEGYQHCRMFDDEIMDLFHEAEDKMARGERIFHPFKACLKDEPTSVTKDKPARVIYAAPIVLQLLCRKYLLTISRYMCTHPIKTESMVGINCMSPEWAEMKKHLSSDGNLNERGFAVDYSNFDQTMPAQITLASYDMYYRMCEASGNYTPRDLMIVKGIASEVAYPIVAYNGTMIGHGGGTASGTNMTVFQNNSDNSLNQRIAFAKVEGNLSEQNGTLVLTKCGVPINFREHVHTGNYGDDVIGGIEPSVDKYNMNTFAQVMGEHGIKVTAADKSDVVPEFVDMRSEEFLKRKDSYIPELHASLGALAEKSIFKCLHSNMRNSNISREQLAVSCIDSALFEWFAHGRDVYEQRREQMKKVCEVHKLDTPSLHLSFDDRCQAWKERYLDGTKTGSFASPLQCIEFMPESGIENHGSIGYQPAKRLGLLRGAFIAILVVTCLGVMATTFLSCGLGSVAGIQNRRPGTCLKLFRRGSAPTLYGSNEEVDASTSTILSSLTYSDTSGYVSTPSESDISPQSGVESFTITHTTENPLNTMGFDSINPGYTYDFGDSSDPTRGAADNPDDSLTDFFKRPVRLGSYVWTVGTPFYDSFNPLTLFIQQRRVANRISNYRNFRGKIHLRFMINGTPFNRGLMLCHAVPLFLNDQFVRARALVQQDCVSGSQNPHVYLNPTMSQGADLVLPFIFQYNAMNLVNGQLNNDWLVVMRDIGPLGNVQGSPSVSIQVVGWMDEIVLSSPTDHNVLGIVPQSGAEDEYGEKPISKTASVIERAAGNLVNAPVIGRMARATELSAKMVGSVANALGYSRPNYIEPSMPLEVRNAGSLASYNLPDSSVKLSLDVKKEVSVDPRTCGLSPVDDMHIATIAKRESYVTTFSWNDQQGSGTDLFFALVSPNIHAKYTPGGGATEYHMTPSCWACVPFEYWRGSMKFRFKVLGTNFHKGRLRISYDPVYSKSTDDFNMVQNHIVDISETKDFTVRVGWSSEQTYLKCGTLGETYFDTAPITPTNLIDNGTIKVEVFTQLVTSDFLVATDTIQVLVFTSMDDDFEVASPRSAVLHNMCYNQPPGGAGLAAPITPQSGEEIMDEGTPEPDIPLKKMVDIEMGGPDHSPTLQLVDVCFGESITSWKQCLQRFCLHNVTKTFEANVANSNYKMSKHWRPDFPIYRGYDPSNGVHTSVSGKYNYTYMTIINWVAPAYVGWKGGIRWKYILPANNALSQATIQVVRAPVNQGWANFEYSLTADASFSNMASFWRDNWSATWQGAHIVQTTNNTVAAVEIPYYNANRFSNARRKDMMLPDTEFRSHTVNYCGMTVTDPILMAFVAGAEDFSLFFFLGVPVCWIVPTDPTPA